MAESFTKSNAPKEVAGEKPETEEAIFALLEWVSNKSAYEIRGFVRVDLYASGYAEAYGVEPEEFEDFLEEHVYDVEDPYLKLVSDETAFNQMLAAHWNQLPLMWRFNGYSGFLKLDEKGLDELIDKYGWLPDTVEEDKKE